MGLGLVVVVMLAWLTTRDSAHADLAPVRTRDEAPDLTGPALRPESPARNRGDVPALPEPVDPPGSFRDGTKLVGKDIEPGTYRADGGTRCYWARLAGLGGEISDLLANGSESGPMIVTISRSDKAFESRRCGIWVPDLSAITDGVDAPFGDGHFIVGTDISAGTWRADSPSRCYWARLKGFSGGMDDLIANGNHKEIVTIAATDKGFKSHRCGTWTKVE